MRLSLPSLATAIGAGLVVLVVGTLLPGGQTCHIWKLEVSFKPAPLWNGLSQYPQVWREADDVSDF